jgi:hypothetical protein
MKYLRTSRVIICRSFDFKFLCFVLIFLGIAFISSPILAETNSCALKVRPVAPISQIIPYGEIIYQSNRENPKQLYIVGLEHRDAVTRQNGTNTPKVQAEVFKIGEWLVRNEDVELLLPEGFFSTKPGNTTGANPRGEKGNITAKSFGLNDLERKLGDNRVYVNAEMLLKQNFQLRLRQVEDKRIYDTVHETLCNFANGSPNSCNLSDLKSDMDFLQEKRVAFILQNIPGVIDEEFRQNHIGNQKALFTIGMSHVSQIIRYLGENRIEITPPLSGSMKGEKCYNAPLNLAKENFGITVIIPQRLAENEEILKITGLSKTTLKSKDRSSPPSSP